MKSALLSSLLIGGAWAQSLVSSDRFLLKIIDQTISLQDFEYQARNLKALHCVYEDAFVVQYFGKSLIRDWEVFLKNFPKDDPVVVRYLHDNEELLKKLRHYFKVLRYADDQKLLITPEVSGLIQKSARENKCDPEIIHKEGLKTNFLSLLRMELYLRSRYAGQLKGSSLSFEAIRSSLDLFVESLDKQFSHEYFW